MAPMSDYRRAPVEVDIPRLRRSVVNPRTTSSSVPARQPEVERGGGLVDRRDRVALEALDAIADGDTQRTGELAYAPAAGGRDEVLANLANSILAALDQPRQVNRLFIDHVMLALAEHIDQTYRGRRADVQPSRGGLAPWQERRAKELLAAKLDGNVSVKEIARKCGLSVGHFSRAFRQSAGVGPHGWLVNQRVEAAKALLRDDTLSLSEIALRCGFSDQSHFTRTFSRVAGTSPGAWRRMRRQ